MPPVRGRSLAPCIARCALEQVPAIRSIVRSHYPPMRGLLQHRDQLAALADAEPGIDGAEMVPYRVIGNRKTVSEGFARSFAFGMVWVVDARFDRCWEPSACPSRRRGGTCFRNHLHDLPPVWRPAVHL